jgi:hypothetical protein
MKLFLTCKSRIKAKIAELEKEKNWLLLTKYSVKPIPTGEQVKNIIRRDDIEKQIKLLQSVL